MPRYNKFGEPCGFDPKTEKIEKKYFWPFFHDGCKKWMFFTKIFFGIFLVPIKLVLIVLVFSMFYITLTLLDIKKKPGSHPTGIRKFLLTHSARLCARTLLFIAGVFWIRVKGKPTILPLYKLSEMKKKRMMNKTQSQSSSRENSRYSEEVGNSESSETVRIRATRSILRKLNPAYVFNHKSALDIPLSVIAGGGTFVSRVEVNSIPFMKKIAKSYEMVMVDRSDVKSREKTAREIEDIMNDRTRFPLIVYPEGVTTNGTSLVNFRPGVFKPGKPIQPVILKYWAPFGDTAWDLQRGLPYFFDILSRPFIIASIRYLPLYEPSSAEKSDAILYANNVRNSMATEMKVPTYDMCYRDKMAFDDYCQRRCTFQECLNKLCEPFRSDIAAALNQE